MCVWCVDVCTPKCLYMFHRALCVSYTICPIWPWTCSARATGLLLSHPRNFFSYRGESSRASVCLRQAEVTRVSCPAAFLPSAGSRQVRPRLHSEKTCHLQRSVSRLKSSLLASGGLIFLQVLCSPGEGNERERGLIFIEGSLCAGPCALHVILFKPHRALPDG